MNELLKKKIRLLEQMIKVREKEIELLKYKNLHGHYPSPMESMQPIHIEQFKIDHNNKMKILNLEIENRELKNGQIPIG